MSEFNIARWFKHMGDQMNIFALLLDKITNLEGSIESLTDIIDDADFNITGPTSSPCGALTWNKIKMNNKQILKLSLEATCNISPTADGFTTSYSIDINRKERGFVAIIGTISVDSPLVFSIEDDTLAPIVRIDPMATSYCSNYLLSGEVCSSDTNQCETLENVRLRVKCTNLGSWFGSINTIALTSKLYVRFRQKVLSDMVTEPIDVSTSANLFIVPIKAKLST